jgi:hypothetical protein
MDIHMFMPICYVFFFVYAGMFILRYNGPASLDSPGSVTEEAVRLLS